MAWAPYEAQASWIALQVNNAKLRALKTTPDEFCRRVGRIIFDSHPALYVPKFLLVGEDVDVTDIASVSAAYATRFFHRLLPVTRVEVDFKIIRYIPGKAEYVFDDVDVAPLVPCLSHGAYNKALINCMLPLEFEREVPWQAGSFVGSYPEDVQKRVLANWTKDGFQP
jgi:hypothetical protein